MYAGVKGDNTQYTIEPVSVSKNGKPTDLTFTASAPLSFNTLTGLADASNSDIKLTFSNNGTASDAIEGVDLRVIGESETSPVLTMDASGITMFSEKTNLNSELGINGLGKGKAVGKMTSVGVDSSGYIAVTSLKELSGALGSVKESAQKELSEHWVKEIGVATKDHTLPVQTLSGGNQQKVVLARWLATHPKILILNGPTVGVDIGAKYDIHKLLRELAKQGMAVLVVSDDVAEITALCDRALIMKAGSMTGEFKGEDLTDDNLYKSTI